MDTINFKISKSKLIAFVGIAILIGAFYLLTERPFFVTLEPPFPDTVFTRIEEKSRLTWYDGLPSYPENSAYIWKKYYMIFPLNNPDLGNQDQILAYLDNWLVKEGWTHSEVGGSCVFLAQSEFLVREKDYFPYIQTGKTSLFGTPDVCIAVWPADSKSNSFWALIATYGK